ncbi:helix-turn-helix domain-containing protein [Nocardia sp. NPDC049149]|uniref:helix-turn-helix domain-containing protein n=1 Tax=Nocardia sp. NPDC049149 TaxID=3364315 RepID=UPI0037114909
MTEIPDIPVIGMASGGPTILRMVLGARLRRLREASGVSREDAGAAIRASDSKISRLELGRVPFRERDLEDLLTLYRFTDRAEREEFLALARQANASGWWQRDSDWLPRWLGTFVGLEQAAQLIRGYEPRFVPGLLQTPEYARAVLRFLHPDEPDEMIERRATLRLRRQEILDRRQPPSVWYVVTESALRFPFGDTEIWQAQLECLVDAVAESNVTIQILPDDAGGSAIAGGPFTVLRFVEPEVTDVVFVPQLTNGALLDKRADLDAYLAVASRLSVAAASHERTPLMLSDYLAKS